MYILCKGNLSGPYMLSVQGMDGVICGHIHYPRIRDINGVTYVNDGDWVRGPLVPGVFKEPRGNIEREYHQWCQQVARTFTQYPQKLQVNACDRSRISCTAGVLHHG